MNDSNNKWDLIWYKSISNLRADSTRTFLGYLWWLFDPIFYMAVFYVVFGVVFQRGGEDFVPFLLVGLVFWRWFESSISSGSQSILEGVQICRQVHVDKTIFPFSELISVTIKQFVVLIPLLSFVVFWYEEIFPSWMYLPLVFLSQLILITGAVFFLAAIVPILPDIMVFVRYGLTLMFFMSGVFFDLSEVSAKLSTLLKINPMLGLIENYRNVLMLNTQPDSLYLIYASSLGIALFIIGLLIIKRLDNQYTRSLFG